MVNFNLLFNSAQVCCVGGGLESYGGFRNGQMGFDYFPYDRLVAGKREGGHATASGGKDLPMPKVDGRRKDDKILALAKTTANECSDETTECMNAPLRSVLSYYVDKAGDGKKGRGGKGGRRSYREDLEEAQALLGCDTEACVLTSDPFIATVVRDNVISPDALRKHMDALYKPPGDVSNHPQMGGAWPSILRNLFRWAEVHDDFLVIAMRDHKSGQLARVDIHDLRFEPDVAPAHIIEVMDTQPGKCRFGTVFNNVTDRTEGVEHAVALFIDCSGRTYETPTISGGAASRRASTRKKKGASGKEDGGEDDASSGDEAGDAGDLPASASVADGKGPWTIEFFNSHGTQPEKAVAEWMEKLRVLLQAFRRDKEDSDDVRTVVASNIQHQGTSIECSLYAQFYVKCRLEGVPHTFFRKNAIPAQAMIQFRKHVFRDGAYTIPKNLGP